MLQNYKDWRYALAVGLAGIIGQALFHFLPRPFHIPFSWGFPLGWGTGSLIWWILARRANRNARGQETRKNEAKRP